MKPKKWSPVDPRHFEGKSLSELQKSLVQAKEFSQEHPEFQFGWHNEYVEELRRRIAERIGK
jgi:hypothetical protein